MTTNYERQLASAEALDSLWRRIVQRTFQVHAFLDDVRSMAEAQGRDFYTLVVADTLGIDYYDVMAVERRIAKEILFYFTYAYDYVRVPGQRVRWLQDSLIIGPPEGDAPWPLPIEPKVGARWPR